MSTYLRVGSRVRLLWHHKYHCPSTSKVEVFNIKPLGRCTQRTTLVKMSAMIDPQIFEHLKTKIDEETQTKDELNQMVQTLERHVSYTQGLLSRVHSTPRSSYSSLLSQIEAAIAAEIQDVAALSTSASKHPYYKCVPGSPLSHRLPCLGMPC